MNAAFRSDGVWKSPPPEHLYRNPVQNCPFAIFLTGGAAHEPRIDAQPVVQRFEMMSPLGIFRPPSAGQRPAIDAHHHMADHVRLHRAHFGMVVTSFVIARASSAFSSAERPG